MSGTFCTLTPLGYGVFSPAGVIHWCGVPSLIQGVWPPCRWRVARFSGEHAAGLGLSPHMGLRRRRDGTLIRGHRHRHTVRVQGHHAGPGPEPMIVVSTGRNRFPPAPVGNRFRKRTRTGRSFVATIVGPR